MKDLIEALSIFLKYGDPYAPTHCEHDVMYVAIPQEVVSDEDIIKLEKLGFDWHEDADCWGSFRFGSC